jgi:hypothetical protein
MWGWMMGVTGIDRVDMLIGRVPWNWIIEFYGGERILHYLMHHTLAYNSRFTRILLLHNEEFGGIDPYLLQRLTRVLGGNTGNISVSRGFRYADIIAGLEKALTVDYDMIVVSHPYMFIYGRLSDYRDASSVTGLIKRLSSSGKRILIFNNVSSLGKHYPEGGGFHHHTVHVIIGLKSKGRGRVVARIFKHPWKPSGAVSYFYIDSFGGVGEWVVQHRLSEWLSIGS